MNANTIVVIDDDPDDLDIIADVIATVDPSANCVTFKDPILAVNASSSNPEVRRTSGLDNSSLTANIGSLKVTQLAEGSTVAITSAMISRSSGSSSITTMVFAFIFTRGKINKRSMSFRCRCVRQVWKSVENWEFSRLKDR